MLRTSEYVLMGIFLCVCWLLLQRSAAVDTSDQSKFLKCAEQYCLAKNYSKLEVPFNDQGLVNITVDLDVLQILEVDDIKFTVSFSMYFGVRWQEPRVIGPPPPEDNPYVPIDLGFIDFLWVPDIYIYHLKSILVTRIFTQFAGLWVVNRTGILYSQETHVTFWCPMRFESYPLDQQTCHFKVGSYAYDNTKMVFSNNLLQYDDSLRNTILDYSVALTELKPEDSLFIWQDIGNYSQTGYEMVLRRNSLKYLVNYYLPSGLFVLVSWVGFLIPPEIVPGRMTLLVTLFLVLINIFNNITSNSPNVEGLTSISAWVITCILFVFAALAGYAWVLFKKNRLARIDHENSRPPKPGNWHGQQLARVDYMFLLWFPVAFLCFNLIYWPYYLIF